MPDESRQIPPADSESVQEAIENARRNWNEWRSVFEHAGSVDNNPLLTNPELFNKFVQEYSVGRTIRTGQRELFHFKLRGTEFIFRTIQPCLCRRWPMGGEKTSGR